MRCRSTPRPRSSSTTRRCSRRPAPTRRTSRRPGTSCTSWRPSSPSGNRYPSVVPWIAPTGRKSHPVLARLLQLVPGREVRVRRLHPGAVRQRRGPGDVARPSTAASRPKFFDPVGVSLQNDYESGLVFNAGKSASQINYSELLGPGGQRQRRELQGDDRPGRRRRVGDAGRPAGTHGGSNGFEGFGINKFSVQKEAAISFIQDGRRVRRPEGDEPDEDPALDRGSTCSTTRRWRRSTRWRRRSSSRASTTRTS